MLFHDLPPVSRPAYQIRRRLSNRVSGPLLKIQESSLDDRKKVRGNNNLADRMREIASEIEAKYPEMKSAFYQLLFHENPSVRIWAAHHILEVMCYDNRCRRNALKEILYIAENDGSIDGLGNQMWLKSWLAEHPADKELL